jgi:hypothetical protein
VNSSWSRAFTPLEKQSSSDLEIVTNSMEWLIHAASGLMAIILFTVAAKRSRDGDAMGAALASLGAVLSATAPIIAKSFSIGG